VRGWGAASELWIFEIAFYTSGIPKLLPRRTSAHLYQSGVVYYIITPVVQLTHCMCVENSLPPFAWSPPSAPSRPLSLEPSTLH